MAKKVRITKGNHIVSYLLFAVNISISGKAIRPALNVGEEGLSSQFFLRGGGRLYRRYQADGYFTFNEDVITAQDKFLFF